MGLEGRVAVVTGSSVGIGKAAALALGEAGARVVVNARTAERVEPVADQLRDDGGDALAVPADVATPEGVTTLFERTLAHYGTVDILVNNAGTTLIAPAEELALEDWRRMLDLNLTGPFLCSQAAARTMLAKGRGVIINVASVAAEFALPRRAAYVATKHGLLGLTKVMGTEWADRGVRVLAVGPAYIETPMVVGARQRGGFSDSDIARRTPLGRIGQPEEVGKVIAFLASDDASYMTATHVHIDGGWMAYGGF